MPEETPSGKSLALSLRNIYETFAVCFPSVIDSARKRLTREMADERIDRWSRNVVRNARIDIEVVGDLPKPGRTYLIMSNHQSLYDVPVLFQVFGPNVRMITKKELFRVPVFGGALTAGQFISIDRSDRNSAIASLDAAKALLASGTHVWIAPEGTRSKDGKLLSFKKGGFNLALEADLPILTVTLKGTRDALNAKGLRSIAGAHVRVTLHPPIDPAKYAPDGKRGRDRLMADVRALMESGL
jgi:1-acyl-sn-glycerol-3-phosphate acyltransferase